MSTIREIEDRHISILSELDELGQFDYLIDLGVKEGRDSAVEKPCFRIEGCKTNIWLKTEQNVIRASSDSLVVLGLLSIIRQMYLGRSRSEIESNPIRFLSSVSEHVVYSEIRENGIKKVYAKIISEDFR